MTKLFRALLFILCFLFPLAPAILADGMLVPPINYWVYQSDQKAVVYFQDNTETLVISIKFQGDAEKFAWIVPVPSRPQVDKAREDLFENLEKLTYDGNYRIMPALGGKYALEADNSSQVIVWETKKIDIYETATLSSTNSKSLQEWLTENGYQYPSAYEYLLREYIEDNWFFVAVKIDTSIEPSIAEEKLKSGHAAPLKFTFATTQPVYPMKISAVTYAPKPTPTPTPFKIEASEVISRKIIPETYYPYPYRNLAVTLYVFSNQKTKASGYTTQYAGQVLPKTIRELSVDKNGEYWVDAQKKMYLTKLYRSYTVSEISDDVVFLLADDNKAVGSGQRWVVNPWLLWGLVLSPLIIEVGVLGWLGRREVERWRRHGSSATD